MWCLAMWVLFKFALDTVLPLPFADFLADHQGSSQSDHRANTGFGSFKLPTCECTERAEPLPNGVQLGLVVETCCMWAWNM